MKASVFGVTVSAALALCACTAPQSALDPAGRGAESIAELFWWMAGGALLIWLIVMGLVVYAVRVNPHRHSRRQTTLFIIGGGAAVPTVVLAVYLSFGLAMIPDLTTPAPPGSVRIEVSGEQWWWRVRYRLPNGGAVELANEIRLPVGEPAQLYLESPDVIHALWIPPLGGKMDMIPGRTNLLKLEPTRTGIFHGVCAEYCGASHALMAFDVVVMEKSEYAAWLREQAMPANAPTSAAAIRGRELFLSNGCGACHTVRGTEARGQVGPDLTHVGGRLRIGAGSLRNEPEELIKWVAHTGEVKPGVHMPHFGMLPDAELRSLAAYLQSLK